MCTTGAGVHGDGRRGGGQRARAEGAWTGGRQARAQRPRRADGCVCTGYARTRIREPGRRRRISAAVRVPRPRSWCRRRARRARCGRGREPGAASGPRAKAAVASMSAAVSDGPMTVTEATPVGGRPVRASTMWAPRRAVPEVATAPVWTGTTATSRLGSCGSSMPMRHGGPAGSRVRQVMSPPAERQKSVPGRAARCAAARSTAQPLTTPHGVEDAAAARRRRRRRTPARRPHRAPAPRRPRAGSRRG